MQLYKITDEIQAIMDQIDPETGELGDELGRQLDQLEIDKGAKALALAKFMKSIDYEILAFKNEEKIMEAKRKRLETKFEGLAQYLGQNISGETYKDAQASITWRASQGVKITGIVADEYMRIKKEPNVSQIKDELKAGKSIEGAILEDRLNLNIK